MLIGPPSMQVNAVPSFLGRPCPVALCHIRDPSLRGRILVTRTSDDDEWVVARLIVTTTRAPASASFVHAT